MTLPKPDRDELSEQADAAFAGGSTHLRLSLDDVTKLLADSEFASKAEAFLREHGSRLHDACCFTSWERDVGGKEPANETRNALAELLRSLPAQPAKEKP